MPLIKNTDFRILGLRLEWWPRWLLLTLPCNYLCTVFPFVGGKSWHCLTGPWTVQSAFLHQHAKHSQLTRDTEIARADQRDTQWLCSDFCCSPSPYVSLGPTLSHLIKGPFGTLSWPSRPSFQGAQISAVSAQQLPFPCATRTHIVRKRPQLSHMAHTQFIVSHTAVTIPSSKKPVLFHPLPPPVDKHNLTELFHILELQILSLLPIYFLCLLLTTWSLLLGEGPAGKNKLALQVHPVFNLLLSHWIPCGGFLTSYCFPSLL